MEKGKEYKISAEGLTPLLSYWKRWQLKNEAQVLVQGNAIVVRGRAITKVINKD
jgi:hypothetical protein